MSILKETKLFMEFKANEKRIEKLEKKYSDMKEYCDAVGFDTREQAEKFREKFIETENELKAELLNNKGLRMRLGMA